MYMEWTVLGCSASLSMVSLSGVVMVMSIDEQQI